MTNALFNGRGFTELEASRLDGAALQSTQRGQFVGSFTTQARFDTLWNVLDSSGVTVAFPGNGTMTATINTTNGSRYRIRSKELFHLPMIVQAVLTLSQRIAGNDLIIRLVTADGLEQVGLQFNGTVATDVRILTGSDGQSQSTNYTSTSLNSASSFMYGFDCDLQDANYFWRSGNSNAGFNVAGQFQHLLPNPEAQYFIEIDFKNTAATASNTVLTLTRVLAVDYTNTTVSVREGFGYNTGGQALPVVVNGGGTLGANANNGRAEYVDSTTNLGVSATYTGTTRDSGTNNSSKPAWLLARAFADQAGTLFIEQSRDGTVWRSAVGESQAVAANETRTLRVPALARYWRVRYVNGATAQTNFELISAQVNI